eukprot:TRINITY_DN12523_c0_g1_i1.p1 TRINITY_DN12523_c0_g1~~TRINITY_DN12523_c0_g1_i1.p1  ORF type:complete len:837 (+),score=123.57 TRINITY_DN12523_c0_g1_i1:47-2512(+)
MVLGQPPVEMQVIDGSLQQVSSCSKNSGDAFVAIASVAKQRTASQRELLAYQPVEVGDTEFGKTPLEEALSGEGLHHSSVGSSRDVSKDTLSLENDCYSMSVIDNVPAVASFALPALSALGQFLVLYFMAFAQNHLFDEGHWLEPISMHSNLNIMKFVAILVSLFKVSTELQHAEALFQAVTIGDIGGSDRRRLCGWFALILQYVVALSVLFVSTSVVLAGFKTVVILTSIFSVFIIVDMDNLLARFVGMSRDLRFVVRIDPELVLARHRRELESGVVRRRFCPVSLPVGIIVLEGFIAVVCNSPPLTILRHGFVSNDDAPEMIADVSHGCCPPILVGTDNVAEVRAGLGSYNYSILLLASPDSPPPRVHWLVLEASHRLQMPTSLQVLEGVDADGNPAALRGSVLSSRVQASYWLQCMAPFFQEGSLARTSPMHEYALITGQKQLYERYVPFAASFLINGLASDGNSYQIYAVAQNPNTLALARQPVISDPLITSVCAPRCESCAKAGPGRCDQCKAGSHRSIDAMCMPCPENCLECGQWVLPGVGWFVGDVSPLSSPLSLSQSSMPCDEDGCANGYGLHSSGNCQRCLVESCLKCDYDQAVCQKCQLGWGLNSTNGTCAPCSHERCACLKAGECDACEAGWGFTKHGICAKCEEGCSLCQRADKCDRCSDGYGPLEGRCKLCPLQCKSCNKSGVGKCDECRPGYGYKEVSRSCVECLPKNCMHCDGDRPKVCLGCETGFGLAPGGACETCGGFCLRCDAAGFCKACEEGFALSEGVCWSCADRCAGCEKAGPGKCDVCYPGYVLDTQTKTCFPQGLEGK